jgi:hypothetical protein
MAKRPSIEAIVPIEGPAIEARPGTPEATERAAHPANLLHVAGNFRTGRCKPPTGIAEALPAAKLAAHMAPAAMILVFIMALLLYAIPPSYFQDAWPRSKVPAIVGFDAADASVVRP